MAKLNPLGRKSIFLGLAIVEKAAQGLGRLGSMDAGSFGQPGRFQDTGCILRLLD